MRTVRTKVYKFSELSEQAKEKAIEWYRNTDYIDTSFIYDEAHNTVKAFNDLFGTCNSRRSWLEISTGNIDDNILELKGIRLRTYIINNYWEQLYSGKRYWSNGNNKKRVSKVFFSHSCELTGICYDESILQPIYEFLEWKLRQDYNKDLDFETLLNDCIQNLEKDIDAEVEYQSSDEAIIETIEANEYEFTKEGRRF